MIGYADGNCLFQGEFAYGKGVVRIYSQSRGRGHRKFFWGLRPQTPSGSLLLFSAPNQKCAPRSLKVVALDNCGVTKLKTLQKLQNRTARIVTSSPFDTPAAPLLQLLCWPSIEKLINRETCTMVYKSLNELAPENLGNIFYKLSDVHTMVLRDTKSNLAVSKMRTAYGQKSFAYRGAKAWNKLDSEMKFNNRRGLRFSHSK